MKIAVAFTFLGIVITAVLYRFVMMFIDDWRPFAVMLGTAVLFVGTIWSAGTVWEYLGKRKSR